MTNPTRIEVNCTTGEVLEIELTDAEVADMAVAAQAAADQQAAREAEAAAVAEAKASANAKLKAIGLTDEEIAALTKQVKVSIRNANGESVDGAVGKIADLPNATTSPSAADVGTARAYNNGAATVSFTPDTTYWAPNSYTATSTPGSFTATGNSPLTVTGLQSNTAYTFSVTATNGFTTSAAANTGTITATSVPAAPTMGTPTVATGQAYSGNANVSVPFTAPATGGKTISSYTVTSSSGGTATGSSSPIAIADVVGTARTYTITATNANGTSTASSASAATTPSSVPQAPTIGTVTVTNGTTVSVPFTAGATGGSAITSYTVTSSPSISCLLNAPLNTIC